MWNILVNWLSVETLSVGRPVSVTIESEIQIVVKVHPHLRTNT